MAYAIDEIRLTNSQPGTRRVLAAHRFGQPGARPKAYIQAGLHADEIPGMLVAHHLIRRLAAIAAAGDLMGEVVVVPLANPIGLDQRLNGVLLGRHAFGGAGNFNRGFPDLAGDAAARLGPHLGPDAKRNVATIRAALAESLGRQAPADEVGALRLALLGLALDADIVLDLHCDQEAVVHLYTAEQLWPDAADLAAELGCRAVFLADQSGGDPFDEACSSPWWRLASQFGAKIPIPLACLAATVELRGQSDVDDATAEADAAALLRVLCRRGLIAGAAPPPPALGCAATPLAGVDRIAAPAAGIVVHHRRLGEVIAAGEVVATLVDPAAPDAATARLPLVARSSGVLWSRCRARLAAAGDVVASIAGAAPLRERTGALLTD
ncbi:MAG: succinylglutamate desuccinylase [Azospirillum sp.]|nr:succinylglutamate desuccinylase [Azospirillum sp.]